MTNTDNDKVIDILARPLDPDGWAAYDRRGTSRPYTSRVRASSQIQALSQAGLTITPKDLGWQGISKAKPGQEYRLGWENSLGNWRTGEGYFIAKYAEEVMDPDDVGAEWLDENEEAGTYCWPEGWYLDLDDYLTPVKPTHFQHLSPSPIKQGDEG